ncbi:hypothetical protein [Streptomyces sp. NBC_00566]|uniref:hypothetical protein n=1 Tax=Streptomyces sp. NBC_00566 TaxID=2975778 RepID=UPI002E816C6A|nr:hypothetical protein [Streptomyces sp. NBC_00566]WUB88270.1 hypothetical protein OG812_17475 [Streptomyces sp. NBC_00566]
MAVINPPAWMQAGSYPARNDRLALSGLLAYPGFSTDEATPLRIRQGVKPSYQNYQMKVRAAATPNMTVIVSGGFAYIDQHDTGGVGTYICANDADLTLTIAPAGGAGQYRKDCIVASVYDAEYAGTASEWRLEVIQGPYAASAGATVRGTLPPNAQLLAEIAIGPSQTSVSAANITDVRNFSVAAGGIVPVGSGIAPPRPHPGQVQYLTDLDRFRYGKLDGSTADIYPSSFTGWKNLSSYGSFQNSASAGSPTPQVADITIGGYRERVFRGVVNFSGVGTGGYAFFLWNTDYRLTAELDVAAGGIPSSAPFRVYLSTAGSWGLTGQSAGMTSMNLAQLRITDPPGVL